jgi:hypothetical protein
MALKEKISQMEYIIFPSEELCSYYKDSTNLALERARDKFGEQVEFKGTIPPYKSSMNNFDPGLYLTLCTGIVYSYFDGEVWHGT